MQTTPQKTPPDSDRIVITGIGLITPVGDSCWNTLRAILEGRSAYRSHESVLVLGSPTGDALRGATISRMDDDVVPRELTGSERSAALFTPAVRECLSRLPVNLHCQVKLEVITKLADSAKVIVAALAKESFRMRISSGDIFTSHNPRSEFIRRIACAGNDMMRLRIEGAAIGCVDSLCDTECLNKLMLAGKLKDPDNPYGIMAGEAAGAVLLERELSARKSGVPILAAIAAAGEAAEPHPWPTGRPSKALGLTTAFHQAFEKLDDKGAGVVHVITDENGERARALEWALTAGRIFPNPEQERHLWHPAGVTGDAGGGISAVVLADALARLILMTPPKGRVALAVSDDAGERQVLCLEHVEQPEREELLADIRRTLDSFEQTMEE